LINPLCGIIGIPAKKFFIWNIIGSYIWTVSLITAGYLLGERLEGSVDKYLLPIVALIIALSLAPIAIEFLKDSKKKRSTEELRNSLSDGADASFSEIVSSILGQAIPISGSSGFIACSWLGEYGVESRYEIIVSSSMGKKGVTQAF